MNGCREDKTTRRRKIKKKNEMRKKKINNRMTEKRKVRTSVWKRRCKVEEKRGGERAKENGDMNE